jgi:hypothetical protein
MKPIAMALRCLVLCACVTAAGAAAVGASGCGGPPEPAPRFSASDAVILVQSNVPDAELWVDERFVAPVGALQGGVALRPGTHRIEVRHARYHGFYETVTVAAHERSTLEVRLVPILE